MPGHGHTPFPVDLQHSPDDLQRVAMRERKGHADERGRGAPCQRIAQHPALLPRDWGLPAELQGRRLGEQRARYGRNKAEDGQVNLVREDPACHG